MFNLYDFICFYISVALSYNEKKVFFNTTLTMSADNNPNSLEKDVRREICLEDFKT